MDATIDIILRSVELQEPVDRLIVEESDEFSLIRDAVREIEESLNVEPSTLTASALPSADVVTTILYET